nr:immunoglobulin heavy chain junction region [Mus musculus]MBK4189122.1 immunoglobulin heavy chain junction region [Mus musculus]
CARFHNLLLRGFDYW